MTLIVRPSDIIIDAKNPFEFDALDRESLETPLSDFLCNAEGPFVMGLDGEWGTGKTTFVKMWRQALINRGCTCLYFNAWETDFADDPLIALVSELTTSIENLVSERDLGIDISQQRRAVRKTAIYLAKKLVPGGIKLLTMNTLNLDEEVENLLGNLVGDIAEDSLSSYEKTKTELNEFHSALQELIALIREVDEHESPLIIFVDELDRCRPNYAIELLERIKHLFNIPGIVFVLSMDRQQLSHSIRALYGSDFDAPEYLRRFIDLDYRLPTPKTGNFCKVLFETFKIKENLDRRSNRQSSAQLEELMSFVLNTAKFNFRKQVQVISRLSIAAQAMRKEHYISPYLLVVLTFIREWDFLSYQQFVEGDIDVEALLSGLFDSFPALDAIHYDEYSNSHKLTCIFEIILLLAAKDKLKEEPSRLSQYRNLAKALHQRFETGTLTDTPTAEEFKAEGIIEQIRNISNNLHFKIETIASYLEMTENFVFESIENT